MQDTARRQAAVGMVVRDNGTNRLAVASYPLYAKSSNQTLSSPLANEVKQEQIQNILLWLNGGALPCLVRGMPDVCPILLEDEKTGTRVLSLINASTGCADEFVVGVEDRHAGAAQQVSYITDKGLLKAVPPRYQQRKDKMLWIRICGAMKFHPYQIRFLVITNP